jgi:hypothetical protein
MVITRELLTMLTTETYRRHDLSDRHWALT